MICAAISRTAIPAMPPKTPSAIASGLIARWALVSMSAGLEDDPPDSRCHERAEAGRRLLDPGSVTGSSGELQAASGVVGAARRELVRQGGRQQHHG